MDIIHLEEVCSIVADMKNKRPGVGLHFLDSGAFSLYSQFLNSEETDYREFFRKDGTAYLDAYAAFIEKYKRAIEYYANVDAIGDPHLTWENQQYLEKEHGLSPIPVVHFKSDMKWLRKYMKKYDYIAFGGLAGKQSISRGRTVIPNKHTMFHWLNRAFALVCNEKGIPQKKIHGFGVGSWSLITRYPWWSVDHTAWLFKAATGKIIIPRVQTNGLVRLDKPPITLSVSHKNPDMKKRNAHVETISAMGRRVVVTWLEILDISIKDITGEQGNTTARLSRLFVNAFYYHILALHTTRNPVRFIPRKTLLGNVL